MWCVFAYMYQGYAYLPLLLQNITTTTEYLPGTAAFPSKFNLKWAHHSGFTVDKLELTSFEKVNVETSLTGVADGLKFEFKGNDSSLGTVGAVYKHKLATFGTELDISGFSFLKASALGGSNGVSAGAAATFALGSKFAVSDYSAAIGWKNDTAFVGLKANNKLADLNTFVHYQVKPNLGLHAQLDFTPKTSTHNVTVGVAYKCNDNNVATKAKITSNGLISASVKKNFPNKLSVVGAVGVDVHKLEAYNFGITATLG